uniref:Uncharacterized protein n=1 Tax=Arundo donax TaxID=35708 RepID=A0A0A9CMF6_ARUDO
MDSHFYYQTGHVISVAEKVKNCQMGQEADGESPQTYDGIMCPRS